MKWLANRPDLNPIENSKKKGKTNKQKISKWDGGLVKCYWRKLEVALWKILLFII